MDAFYASVELRDNPELRGTHFWANTYAERYRPALTDRTPGGEPAAELL
jgi:hypothetical protein